MNIYADRSKYKIIIVLVALLIGSSSVYYTNYLVTRLAQREREQIQLYANAYRFIVGPENNESIDFVFQEVIRAIDIFPVILTSGNDTIINYRNVKMPASVEELPITDERKQSFLKDELEIMKEEHSPIKIDMGPGQSQYIYYRNSYLLSQLQYYPYVQLTVIAVFAFLAYLAFSYSRTAEQNQVWVGLAKETAHQLGTPLSSLMAWIEYFKTDPKFADDEVIPELEKDVERLEMITARFSNIGSMPTLKPENLYDILEHITAYLQRRISSKIKIHIKGDKNLPFVNINKHLFEWVIENICKNAVDAMSGSGEITINLKLLNTNKILIDITDNGKGISKSNITRVFEPGFSTKKRGWGLGLTLAKRIIENYHSGKIFIKQSEINKGTTFRIVLNAE
ncbi:histidine kinase [Rhodocytophaga rosea]|uniref:histidine kinase n=1 Tax=Rhodocytophaga rosea TaxID=2704465 RepID=A0A6C0GR96_9BACT|nr:ATP-binding protein [Rhodocytophaga rosea]QHT70588.1 histidine kinase [Rhodocytophaga rosea]